jgi:Cd2+/Zn2+-exporting ATPase
MEKFEKKYKMKNLFCAGCAGKIEEKILELPFVKGGYYNFANQTITLSLKEEVEEESLKKTMQTIADKIENGVIVESIKSNEDNHGHEEVMSKKETALMLAGLLIFLFNIFFINNTNIRNLIFIISYLLSGSDIVLRAFRDIGKKNFFDENFLMTVATFGAFGIGEYPEAAAVMIFFKIGEYFQGKAISNSRKSIKELMDIKPAYANVLKENNLIKMEPEEVRIGDLIVVKAGERVPLDGVVKKGSSILDTSMLTGESKPRKIKEGSEVLSGCINKSGVIEIEVSQNYYHSTVNKILELIEEAGGRKCETEKFISRFSKYYTPFVVLSALFIAIIPTILYGDFHLWLYRALIFLVISCPCALVISVPLGFFGGIGRASKEGILIKGSNYLDNLHKIESIVFDKTGTLTKGQFEVIDIKTYNTSEVEVLNTAFKAEFYSNHPIAHSIKEYCNENIDISKLDNYKELDGLGIIVYDDNQKIVVGNKKLMEFEGIDYIEHKNEYGTIVYVARNKVFLGSIIIRDEIKDEVKLAVKELKAKGKKVYMLTGDNQETAKKIGEMIEIDDDKIYFDLLPQNKVEIYDEIKNKSKGLVIFVGDGINDAPVLARADIGISMGGVGSDAAIEASDIVLMEDNPIKIDTALDISKKTRAIVMQNIIFALGIKLLIMILGVLGDATMWEAIFADVGVALIAILNSMRILKK